MFSLIIAIVAIGVVVALVAAVMYYGGTDAFLKGQAEAEIARNLNELSQIEAGLTAYHAHTGTYAADIHDLVPRYLSSIPAGWGVEVPSQVAFQSARLLVGTEADKEASCGEINRRLGLGSVPPSCADIESNFTGCCLVPDAAAN